MGGCLQQLSFINNESRNAQPEVSAPAHQGCLQQLSFQVEKRAARSSTLQEAVSQASFGSKSASSMIQQKRETHQGYLQQLSFINNESRNAQPEVSAPAHQG